MRYFECKNTKPHSLIHFLISNLQYQIFGLQTMKTLIDKNIRIFSPDNTVAEAVVYLSEKELSHAIIVRDTQFLGVLSLGDLLEYSKEQPLQSYEYLYKNECVTDNKHWLHAYHLFERFRSNILAVVDSQFHFVGTYQMEEFTDKIKQLPLIEKPGVVFVVQGEDSMDLSEKTVKMIAQNQGVLLGIFPTIMEPLHTELTVKIESQNSDKILESIRRAGIQLLYSDTLDFEQESLQDNADYFNTYLSI